MVFLGIVPTFFFLHDSQGVVFQFMMAIACMAQDKVEDKFRRNLATRLSAENTTGRDYEPQYEVTPLHGVRVGKGWTCLVRHTIYWPWWR
jgi:hypothetical protein